VNHTLRQQLRRRISDARRQQLHQELYDNRGCQRCERHIEHPTAIYCSEQCRKKAWEARTGKGGRYRHEVTV